MKSLLVGLLVLIQGSVMADSVDEKRVNFIGQELAEVLLQTEKTRTEWRTVTVPATCYRTEYRRRCTTQGRSCRTRCDRNRQNCRRICTGGQRVCRNVPVNVPYRCHRTESRPYQVHDYFVNTRATFNFNNEEVDGGANELFKVRVTGEADSLSVNATDNYAILLKDRTRSEQRNGGYKDVFVNYDVDFIKTKRITETLGNGIQNVKYRNGVLSFNVGRGFNTTEFTQNLKIYRYKRVGRDRLLLNRNITENEMDVSANGDQTLLSINLKNLGITLPSKIRVIMKTSFNLPTGELLNKNLKTEASANWIFR